MFSITVYESPHFPILCPLEFFFISYPSVTSNLVESLLKPQSEKDLI